MTLATNNEQKEENYQLHKKNEVNSFLGKKKSYNKIDKTM